MFDFTGHPLASLNIFKYLKYGATAPLAIDTIPDIVVSCNIGAEVKLPDTVSIIYNDRSEEQVPVTWDAEDIAAIDTETAESSQLPDLWMKVRKLLPLSR